MKLAAVIATNIVAVMTMLLFVTNHLNLQQIVKSMTDGSQFYI